MLERTPDGRPEVGRSEVIGSCRPTLVGNHHLVLERVDERPGDGDRQRGDEAYPQRRQTWGEDRYGGDEASRQAGDLGVGLHHSLIRENVGAADLDDMVILDRGTETGDEVLDDVADGDWLAQGPNPRRRDHHRQHLGQVAEHLE